MERERSLARSALPDRETLKNPPPHFAFHLLRTRDRPRSRTATTQRAHRRTTVPSVSICVHPRFIHFGLRNGCELASGTKLSKTIFATEVAPRWRNRGRMRGRNESWLIGRLIGQQTQFGPLKIPNRHGFMLGRGGRSGDHRDGRTRHERIHANDNQPEGRHRTPCHREARPQEPPAGEQFGSPDRVRGGNPEAGGGQDFLAPRGGRLPQRLAQESLLKVLGVHGKMGLPARKRKGA